MDQPYYDLNPANKSFLDMHKYLKSVGVKNNKFMLTLNNDLLLNVDPYDPNLPWTTKFAVIRECMENVWYYLRIIRLPDAGGGTVPYILDRSNMAQVYLTMRECSSWVTKPRMLRKTSYTLALLNWIRIFDGYIDDEEENLNIALISRTVRDNNILRDTMEEYTKLLPKCIRDFDIDKFKSLYGNPHGRMQSPEEAVRVAKNLDSMTVFIDEAEFVNYVNLIIDNANKDSYELPWFKEASKIFKHKAILCCSTINDDLSKSGADKILSDCIKWDDEFYDSSDVGLHYILGQYNMFHIYTTYKDLGLGDEYYNEMSTMLLNDQDAIRREVLLERKEGSVLYGRH
jgi:hypothetical protein